MAMTWSLTSSWAQVTEALVSPWSSHPSQVRFTACTAAFVATGTSG